MNRQEEIKQLEALKGDTYFAQYFGADIDTMIVNIQNDFAIESGCKFHEEKEALVANLSQQREEFKEKELSFVESLLAEIEPDDLSTDLIKQIAEMAGGRLEYIKCKRRMERTINNYDIDYLIRKAEQ